MEEGGGRSEGGGALPGRHHGARLLGEGGGLGLPLGLGGQVSQVSQVSQVTGVR